MHILLVEITIQIPSAHSLKEKRSSVKSIVTRLRDHFNVSVAEVEHHDVWQTAGLAIVTVSNIQSRVEKTARQALEMIESRFDVVVIGIQETWL